MIEQAEAGIDTHPHRHTSLLRVLSFNGAYLAVADVKRKPHIIISSVEDEQVIATYLGHQAGLYHRMPVITAIVWSPDGKCIASGGSDGSLHIWDAYRALPLRTLIDLNEAFPVRAVTWNGNTLTALCGEVTHAWQV